MTTGQWVVIAIGAFIAVLILMGILFKGEGDE